MNTAVQHDDSLLSPENLPLLVHFQPVLQLTDDQFYDWPTFEDGKEV
jgi:hypothetical protein